MPDEPLAPVLADRIRRLAEFLGTTDVVRVRIERPGDELEIARARPIPTTTPAASAAADGVSEKASLRLDAIKAELVGILRLSRPLPIEGDVLVGDRELGYIEALGIRNPVHSLGGGRLVTIACADGAPVEYGQPLFLLDRG